jgi:hypothetical protein
MEADSHSEAHDIAKHLRTVHVSLLLLCAILLIAAIETDTTIEQAMAQLAKIKERSTHWSEFAEDYWKHVDDKVTNQHGWESLRAPEPTDGKLSPPLRTSFFFQTSAPNSRWMTFKTDSMRLWTLSNSCGVIVAASSGVKEGSLGAIAGSEPPTTLFEFERRWNDLEAVRLTLSVVDSLFLCDTSNSPATPPPQLRSQREGRGPSVTCNVECGGSGNDQQMDQVYRLRKSGVKGRIVRWQLVAHSRIATGSVQAPIAFLKEKLAVKDETDEFRKAFSCLLGTANGYYELPYAYLEQRLKERDAKNPRSVSLFGVEIPVRSLGRWGLPILVAIQTYLLLTLNEFRKRIKTNPLLERRYPWFALYDQPLATICFVVTVLLLPCVTAIIVSWRTGGDSVFSAAEVCYCAGTVILAVRTGQSFEVVWLILRRTVVRGNLESRLGGS